MTFSSALWKKHESIYKQILSHPFNMKLSDGTLDQKNFLFYLEQDASFLLSFSQTLALIAARSNSSQRIISILKLALDAIESERQLHVHLLGKIDSFSEPTFSCFSYMHYLLATAALSPLEEAIAAILPCFWVYREIGYHMLSSTHSHHPYALWINSYSHPDFSLATESVISLLNDTAIACCPDQLAKMDKAFKTSIELEWHFWNDAYHFNLFSINGNNGLGCNPK